MRIGLDFHFLAIPRHGLVRGIPRFAQEQLQAVLELDSDNTYLLLCDAGVDVEAVRSEIRMAPNTHLMCAPDSLAPSWPRIADNRTLLSRFSAYLRWLEGLQLDLFHTTCSAMLTGVLMPGFDVCPYVVTAHDLIPLLYPAHYLPDPVDRETYAQRLLFLEQATRIAANSHATAADVVERLGVAPDRIDITPPAPSLTFRPLPRDAVRSVLTALSHPTRLRSRRHVEIPASYVLCITDLHYSKNLTTLLPAYAELSAATRSRSPLVIAGHLAAGEMDAVQRLADQLGVGGDLIVTGRVSDQELAALYNGSTLTVHPSHHEGFGYPVVEAMRCGAPVITTTRSALPETAGDAAVLVDSDDAAAFTRTIDLLLRDSERRDDLRRRGLEHAKRYTTAEFGRTTLQCYRSAASMPKRATEDAIRVAVWSPIPPQDCPGACYIEDLVTALNAAPDSSLELDLFVDDDVAPPLQLLRAARVHHHSDFDRAVRHRSFDAVVYEVGASREHTYMEPALLSHPGVVVLHDLQWSRALLGGSVARNEDDALFRAEVDARDGEGAVREWDRIRTLPSRGRSSERQRFLREHPMLGPIVDTATCCVATTTALERELTCRYPQADVAGVIPLGVRDPRRHGYGVDRASARGYLDLDRYAFVVLVPATGFSAEAVQSALVAFTGLRRAGVDCIAAIIGSIADGAQEDDLRARAEHLGITDA
ncbi:MAG TPA: glycosyltransferase family 1 protein [Candidatus Dormibacteraeota bacterium]